MGKVGNRVPLQLRRELLSLERLLKDVPDSRLLAREHGEPDGYPFILSSASSPLERVKGAIASDLQRGKEVNVSLAAGHIDGTVIMPGGLFSYHALVGRPSRLRGFRRGLELRNGQEAAGIGGGLCQVSNMLYLLAITSGMRIVERHRHGLDLFPDSQRTVPFGCGATVCYRAQDLRFENPLREAVMVRLELSEGSLEGKVLSASDPGFRVFIEERDHGFFEENGFRMRENRIWRRIVDKEGALLREELLAHNLCRVVY